MTTPITDKDGSALVVGSSIVILDTPPGLASGLPDEDVIFLGTVMGMTGTIDEIDHDGRVSVMVRNPLDRSYHFIWIGPQDVQSCIKLAR